MPTKASFIKCRRAEYATIADFQDIYQEEMDGLYVLSVILTGDVEKAEQCFVSALQECLHGMDVFIEWARSWARRAIIKHAIRLIVPLPESVDSLPSLGPLGSSAPGMNDMAGAVFAMGAFERFVFVMSLLERLSDEECSVLLGCAKWDIKTSRVRALQRLSNFSGGCDQLVADFPMRLSCHPASSDHRNRS
jgi:hypothetical protein